MQCVKCKQELDGSPTSAICNTCASISTVINYGDIIATLTQEVAELKEQINASAIYHDGVAIQLQSQAKTIKSQKERIEKLVKGLNEISDAYENDPDFFREMHNPLKIRIEEIGKLLTPDTEGE